MSGFRNAPSVRRDTPSGHAQSARRNRICSPGYRRRRRVTNEVDRDTVLPAVLDECRNPCGLRGRRPSDAQARIHRLETRGRVVVQRPVSGLLRLACPKIEIGLIPHLEVPPADLVDSVTLDQVPGERRDQRIPPAIVLGRRNDGTVPEALSYIAAGELTRHEAELDERSNAVGEQAIVHLVDVREVVYGLSLRTFRVHAELVVEDGVKADIGDGCDAADSAQVVTITLAQSQRRAS